MARNLTASFIAAIQSSSCRPILLFEGAFDGSTLRLWNGTNDLSWDSQTWLGNGWLQGYEGAEESVEVEANDMMIILSGVPSSVVSLALGSQVQGAAGSLYFGMLDSSGAVIADPYLLWRGYYSHAELDAEPDEATLKLYYDGPLVDIDRPNEGRWTNECQTSPSLFPGDAGFQYVIATANWNANWGQGKKNKNDKKQTRPQPPKGGNKSRRRR